MDIQQASSYQPAVAIRKSLAIQIERVADGCTHCPKCKAECAFLKNSATPGTIAASYDPEDPAWRLLAYECHLCGMCAAVCPVGLGPDAMFLEMRREAVDRGAAPLPAHDRLIHYERRGTSRRYSWYSLPSKCDTVLFPGCTFAGTRMDTTIALFEHLKQKIPNLGIVLDCCCKPSHDLGRSRFFQDMMDEMRVFLMDHGVQTIIAVCPNCYKVFKTCANPLSVKMVYELIATDRTPFDAKHLNASERLSMAIHDPCVLREESGIQDAVRKLAASAGFDICEMPHSREKTICCGEGGAVGFLKPEFSDRWGEIRKNEAKNRRLLTYCAGCAGFLNRKIPTDHVLDAFFYRDRVSTGKRKATKAPLTYFNRIRLKRYLQKKHPAPVTRERDFTPESAKTSPKRMNIKKIIIITMLAAAIAGIRLSGILQHFDPDSLRQTVAASGPLAPVVFILLYTFAPALFLPGLPLTIAGGILFGPIWGVVYSITGATAGASVAFLISRYAARKWVQAKLSGPRWRQLDQNVSKNGWKIVAFTRLVPLFPFNLLNYAFGLTPIRFLPYALTSFVCMLPACIAFIVFSSSLLDLLKGKISPAFLIGLGLIGMVSFIPVLIRKRQHIKADQFN